MNEENVKLVMSLDDDGIDELFESLLSSVLTKLLREQRFESRDHGAYSF